MEDKELEEKLKEEFLILEKPYDKLSVVLERFKQKEKPLETDDKAIPNT